MKRQSRFTGMLALCVSMMVVLAACGTPAAPSGGTGATTQAGGSQEPFKIGLITSLTGPVAAPGKEMRDGVVLEVERINAAGGINGRQIQLITEDDGSDATKASTAATKLMRQDQVLAIVGPLAEFLSQSVGPLADREGVSVLATTSFGTDLLKNNFKNVFSLGPSNPIVLDAMQAVLKENNYTNVVAMGDSVPLHQNIVSELGAKVTGQGVTYTLLSDTFNNGDVDLTAQVTKVKAAADQQNAQAIVLATNGVSVVSFMKAVQQLGVKQPVIGGPAFGLAVMLMMGGSEVNGVRFVAPKILAPDQLPDSDAQKKTLLDFVQRYTAKYTMPPGLVAAHGADGVNIIANALKTAGADRAKIRDAIEATTNFQGATGIFNMTAADHSGLAPNALAIYEVKDKKFTMVRPVQ